MNWDFLVVAVLNVPLSLLGMHMFIEVFFGCLILFKLFIKSSSRRQQPFILLAAAVYFIIF
jgi:hypothetical protein